MSCALAPTISRKDYLGSSDIAAVVGLDPWKSPFDIFVEKTADIADDGSMSEPMRWGKLLERPISAEYERRHGVTLVKMFDEPQIHPERKFHGGSPDALLPSDRLLFEAKTAGLRQAHLWGEQGDDVPESYLLQVQWLLSLIDYDVADIAVLIGGQEYREYQVQRDHELEGYLLAAGEEFWIHNVLANVPPPISATSRAQQWLRQRFPREREDLRPATEDEALLASALFARKTQRDRLCELVEQTENELKARIGDAVGLSGESWTCTWKTTKDGSKTDWESIARGLASRVSVRKFNTLLGLHTRIVPGSRRFLAKSDAEKEQ